jgi:hypothetical protein
MFGAQPNPRQRAHPGRLSQARRWADRFSRSRLHDNIFYVRGTHETHWGARDRWVDILGQITTVLEHHGVPVKEYSSGSPINASSYEFYAAFLDGGVVSLAGDYFTGLHGAWVKGRLALRFLCYELDLSQPRFRGETDAVPSHEELRAQIYDQTHSGREILLERLNHMRAWL